MKRSFITFSVALVLSSTSSMAFVEGGSKNFSFDNRLVDAVEMNNVDIVKAILDNGANPNETGKFETSALHRAAYNDNTELMQLLISKGADVNFRDYGGATPLHLAARMGGVDASIELLKDGADVNAYDDQGYTPLHRAIVNRQEPTSMFLLQNGAEVNTVNNEGNSPLIDAVRISDPKLVQALIVKGADKRVKNKKGLDAIDYAMKMGNNQVDALLSKPVQDLMKGESLSQDSVIARVEPKTEIETTEPAPETYQVAAKEVPDFLKQEAAGQSKMGATETPLFATNSGDQFIEAVKVPTETVQVEEVASLTQDEKNAEAEAHKKLEDRYRFANVQYKKELQVEMPERNNDLKAIDIASAQPTTAAEAELAKAPRLADDGRLPASLAADFRHAVKTQNEQKTQQQIFISKTDNRNNIELPKEMAEIENRNDTIILAPSLSPQQQQITKIVKTQPANNSKYELVPPKDAEAEMAMEKPKSLAEDKVAAAEFLKNEAELNRKQRVLNDSALAELQPENNISAPVAPQRFAELPKPQPAMQTAQPRDIKPQPAEIEMARRELNDVAPASNNISNMLSSDAQAAPAPQMDVKDVAVVPLADYSQQNIVLAMNDVNDSPVVVDKKYEGEVDNLFSKLIGSAPQQPQQMPASAPTADAYAFPPSLQYKQFTEKKMMGLPVSNNTNNYFNNIKETNFTEQPVYFNAPKSAPVTNDINDWIASAPVEPVAVSNETPAEMPGFRRSKNPNYDNYRANLVSDINQFYNNNSADHRNYDISDLERQRVSNLGTMSSSTPEKPLEMKPAEIKTEKATTPATDMKATLAAPKTSDTVAAPTTAVETESLDTLESPEEEIGTEEPKVEITTDGKKADSTQSEVDKLVEVVPTKPEEKKEEPKKDEKTETPADTLLEEMPMPEVPARPETPKN